MGDRSPAWDILTLISYENAAISSGYSWNIFFDFFTMPSAASKVKEAEELTDMTNL